MRGNQIIGLDRKLMHQRISIIRRSFRRVGSSASGDHIPIKAVVGGTFRSNGFVSSGARLLHAVEKGPIQRKVILICSIVVLNCTCLIHIANAFIYAVLTSERPCSISILLFICISIRKRTKVDNRSNCG